MSTASLVFGDLGSRTWVEVANPRPRTAERATQGTLGAWPPRGPLPACVSARAEPCFVISIFVFLHFLALFLIKYPHLVDN